MIKHKKDTLFNINHNQVWIIASVCIAATILPLSFTGGAIAISSISQDIGGTPLALNWITNAFMLSFGSLLMATGGLADRFGRKLVFISGILSFSIISTLIIWVPNIIYLDLLRAAQGIAAAATLAGGTAALAQEFEGITLTRVFSLLGTSFGIGLAFGPLLAGLLIKYYSWHAVFLSSAIIGVLALLMGLPKIRESRNPYVANFDWLGTIIFTSMLGLFTWAILQTSTSGWTSLTTLSLLLAASLLLLIFIQVEKHIPHPMLDLSLFQYPPFLIVQMLPIATCYCYVVLLIVLPLQLIGIVGKNEVEAGLIMLMLSIPMLIVPSLAANLTHWISAGKISIIGLLIAAFGLYWLSNIIFDQHKSIIGPLLLIGIGTGLPWGLMDGLAVSVIPKERAGMATGIFSTTRVVSEGIAIAIVNVLFILIIKQHLPATIQNTTIAQYLAIGNLVAAKNYDPSIDTNLLIQAYNHSFQWLIYILIFITIISAIIIGCLLNEDNKHKH